MTLQYVYSFSHQGSSSSGHVARRQQFWKEFRIEKIRELPSKTSPCPAVNEKQILTYSSPGKECRCLS